MEECISVPSVFSDLIPRWLHDRRLDTSWLWIAALSLCVTSVTPTCGTGTSMSRKSRLMMSRLRGASLRIDGGWKTNIMGTVMAVYSLSLEDVWGDGELLDQQYVEMVCLAKDVKHWRCSKYCYNCTSVWIIRTGKKDDVCTVLWFLHSKSNRYMVLLMNEIVCSGRNSRNENKQANTWNVQMTSK